MKTLHMLKSQKNIVGQSILFKSDGDLIVIDGGYPHETENLLNHIKSLGGRVTGWFLTHAHDDHISALCEILEKYSNEVKIDTIYYNFPTDEQLIRYEPNEEAATRRLMPILRNRAKECGIAVVTPHKGDEYAYAGFKIRILREPDMHLTTNFINNSSIVFRIEVENKRILFLGDLGAEGGEELLRTVPREELKADYVQMAHHGQKGVEKAVYEAIDPDYCIWCTSDWLWDNIGENGYDTNEFQTIITRGWMSELGIKKHYIEKDWPDTIEF